MHGKLSPHEYDEPVGLLAIISPKPPASLMDKPELTMADGSDSEVKQSTTLPTIQESLVDRDEHSLSRNIRTIIYIINVEKKTDLTGLERLP